MTPNVIDGYEFTVALMLLFFYEFNVILGMDWLIVHDAVVSCKQRLIVLKRPNGGLVRFKADKFDYITSIILDTWASELKIDQVPTVREFPNIFLEELPRPLEREVEFVINLVPRTAPISIALYRMTPKKLKELKTQLQELIDRGFIRPSVSP
ncbi:Gag protease polyprotein [Gossypium australe]|uniref:Gag protease polyprotein n=1 Tax=Gossypium australe TaxID=47621 RepID=A0A5B6UV25_9ROSI|nr:Gag protease polyprotein [Gossypium australe]